MRKEAVRKPDLFLPHPEPSSGDGGRNGSAGEDGIERMSTPPPVSLLLLGKQDSQPNSQRRFMGALARELP